MRILTSAFFASFAGACLCGGALQGEDADALVKEHGKYSKAYQGDWSKLKSGKELAAWDMTKIKLREVAGETARREITAQPEVRISGLRLKVSWQEPSQNAAAFKYSKALYLIRNCERVVIEDCVVEFADGDGRASSAFYIEDCGHVEIRNVRVAGAGFKPKIRLEGVTSYFIDRLEICGLDYGNGEGFKCGEGLFLNNGEGWDEAKRRPGARVYFAPGYRCMKWGVVQNSYFHDHTPKERENHDGILLHSPGDGIVFNSYFENWYADGAVDLSHRRGDDDYGGGHVYSVERCVFKNCMHAKSPGAGDLGKGNQIRWANNVFINTGFTEYNRDNQLWLVNNTWYVEDLKPGSRLASRFVELWPGRGSAFHMLNNLVVAKLPLKLMFDFRSLSNVIERKASPLEYAFDFNCYCLPPPGNWLQERTKALAVGEEVKSWDEWRKAGYEAHGIWNSSPAAAGLLDPAAGDFGISPSSLAVGKGSSEALKAGKLAVPVLRDFKGRLRDATPSCGAFEPERK